MKPFGRRNIAKNSFLCSWNIKFSQMGFAQPRILVVRTRGRIKGYTFTNLMVRRSKVMFVCVFMFVCVIVRVYVCLGVFVCMCLCVFV